MIIRFDHLTYVCNETNLSQVLSEFERIGYVESFREVNIPNIAPKMPLMRYPNKTHSLYFFEKANCIPIEVISYECTTINCPMIDYMLNGDTFNCYTKEINALKGLYGCLGIKEIDDLTLNVKGVLDRTNAFVHFIQAENPSVNLDNEGFTCPTLFVDSYLKTKEKVEENGYRCTESSPITINGRELKIFFILGKYGEVLELISNK